MDEQVEEFSEPSWPKRLDRVVAGLTVFFVLLFPAFKPAWRFAFRGELRFIEAFEREQAHLQDFYRTGDTDPWGNPWQGFCRAYSMGPNGIDESRRGDDIQVWSSGPSRLTWPGYHGIYERAPLDYLALVLIASATYAAARLLRRGSGPLREGANSVLLSAPLAAALYWLAHELWPWEFERLLGDRVLVPLPVAEAGAIFLGVLLCVVALRLTPRSELHR